jgi:oligoribonuclease NrnB/cAMP/cGMP phosphodiesterase (DHH superfamily)
MDDRLIDDERLPVSRRSVIPGEGFFVPDSVEQQAEEQRAQEALSGAEVAVVTDTDADGLACAALVRAARGEAALVPSGPHDLAEDLRRTAEYGESGLEVFVCDLCPDEYADVEEPLAALAAAADAVSWYDHHQWDDAVAEAVRAAGVDLVVGESDEECTADVAVRAMDHDFPDHLVELAAVTRDHDLWIKDDPRSDDLADYARWADDEETYIETVREHGADLPDDARELLAERRELKEDLIERAVGRAELREVGPWTVGLTYGRCSQNEVAEAMRERGADASVVIKPAGSISLRGTDAFQRCHEVAAKLNGGGHPKAAGCKPDVYDDMLDMAHHWTTRGAVAKRTVLAAFEERLAELRDAGELDDETAADPDA